MGESHGDKQQMRRQEVLKKVNSIWCLLSCTTANKGAPRIAESCGGYKCSRLLERGQV